jgi:hypothetical protein
MQRDNSTAGFWQRSSTALGFLRLTMQERDLWKIQGIVEALLIKGWQEAQVRALYDQVRAEEQTPASPLPSYDDLMSRDIPPEASPSHPAHRKA